MVAEIVDGTPMSVRGGRRERRLRRPVFRPVSAERSTAGVTGRMDGRSSTSPNSDFGKDILVPDVTGERAPARGGVPESIFWIGLHGPVPLGRAPRRRPTFDNGPVIGSYPVMKTSGRGGCPNAATSRASTKIELGNEWIT